MTARPWAAPSGSSREALRSVENSEKAAGISGGFFALLTRAAGRENAAGLLDIGGALC